jgi:hypothetical protein
MTDIQDLMAERPSGFMMPRSTGSKLILWPSATGEGPEYSIGVEANAMWFNTFNTTNQYKLYFMSVQRYVFDNNNLTLPAAPTANMHAATKQYVDQQAGGAPGNWTNLAVGAATNEWTTGTARAKTILGGAFAHLQINNTVRDSQIPAGTFRNRYASSMPTQFRPPQNLWVSALSSQTNAICFAQITTAGEINIYAQVAIPAGATVQLICDYATTVGAPP